jgi:signal transduction histidine kinase
VASLADDLPVLAESDVAGAPRRQLVRLAYDVHDGPLQSLTAAGYSIHELQRRLTASQTVDAEAMSAELERIVTQLAGAESGLRLLISRLEHGQAEIATVGQALDPEIEAFRQRCPIQVDVDIPGELRPDSHSQLVAIRSVVREALTNIARHSSAQHVQVRIEAGPAGILVEVEDDGCGFDPDEIRPDTLGLAGMRHRVELLGGEFEVLSAAGGPTVVTARLERWYGG